MSDRTPLTGSVFVRPQKTRGQGKDTTHRSRDLPPGSSVGFVTVVGVAFYGSLVLWWFL